MRDQWATIGTVAKRELAAYFESPVAYVFLVIYLLLAGFFTFTFGGFFERGEASLAALFNWMPWLFLFLVPAAEDVVLLRGFVLLLVVMHFLQQHRGVGISRRLG